MKADVKVRNQSQPVSLSEDPAHLTCLGLMAFKSPPIPNQTPLTPTRRSLLSNPISARHWDNLFTD